MSAPSSSGALPDTMRAIRIDAHGDLDALAATEVPRPEPGPGEVLVEVRAAGLNHLDLWVRKGVPGHEFPLPLIPGCDGAGVVAALGEGTKRAAVGDEVILAPGLSCGVCAACLSGRDPFCTQYGILGETRDGTCAEFVVVPEANLIQKPKSAPWEEAGCFALVALTAWTMLTDRAQLGPGETVLVLAGGSGVGSLGIQIAKFLGARVIATAGGAEKCERVAHLGADEVIDHSSTSISKAVKSWTDGRGVDVVFEHVGAATWDESLKSLAWGGRLVTCGATTGADASVHLRRLFFKSQSILGSTMGPRSHLFPLVDLFDQRILTPVLAEALPLTDLPEAHRRLEAREVFGKLVVTP